MSAGASDPRDPIDIDSVGGLIGASAFSVNRNELPESDRARLGLLHVFEISSRIASDILASRNGTDALQHFADAARRMVGANYAAIGVARHSGPGFDGFFISGMTPEVRAGIESEPVGAGLLGHLLRVTRPLRLENLAADPHSSGFPAGHPPMRSFLGVPIRHKDVVLGALYLTDKPGGFTADDETTVSALGLHLAVAIRNLHMIRRQQDLVGGLIAAQEAERRAVAYDLHDGLTQYVMGAWAHLEGYRASRDATVDDPHIEELEQGLRFLKEAVVESRRLVNGLRTLYLDDLGLAGAVEQLLFEERDRASWEDASLAHNIGEDRFPETMETAVYRVVQEALTNVRKHAKARRVAVRIEFTSESGADSMLSLEVEDDGKGFDPEAAGRSVGRVGLHGMAERIRLLDGSLDIESEIGNGTVIKARIPLSGTNAEVRTG
ncbi:MAG: GAF domain-containing protein [Armatimonadota bacterium]